MDNRAAEARRSTLYPRRAVLPATVLERAPRRKANDLLLAIFAGMRHAASDLTLTGIAKRLEDMRERTSRRYTKWYSAMVQMLLQRVRKVRMAADS